MTQLGLFASMEQRRQIERVASRIGRSVEAFCRSRGVGSQGVAPASADRILRLLRAEGRVDYVVENRRASLYRITELGDV